MKTRIIHKKVSDLKPYKNNSRTHSDHQINQIKNSINEFGFTNPILVNEKNGIIAGHGRLLAAKELELDKVPCIVLSGLTKEQQKALVIIDFDDALQRGFVKLNKSVMEQYEEDHNE